VPIVCNATPSFSSIEKLPKRLKLYFDAQLEAKQKIEIMMFEGLLVSQLLDVNESL